MATFRYSKLGLAAIAAGVTMRQAGMQPLKGPGRHRTAGRTLTSHDSVNRWDLILAK